MQICGSPHRTDSPSSWVGGCRSNESTWRVLKFETFPPPNKNTRNKGPLNNRPQKFETFKRKGCQEGIIYIGTYQPNQPQSTYQQKTRTCRLISGRVASRRCAKLWGLPVSRTMSIWHWAQGRLLFFLRRMAWWAENKRNMKSQRILLGRSSEVIVTS